VEDSSATRFDKRAYGGEADFEYPIPNKEFPGMKERDPTLQ
jgi:hypothetical protein